MADLNIQKPFIKEIASMVDQMDGDKTQTEVTSRVGEITFGDGRLAQVHVTVTTEVDDFLDLT